jgi:hypothetical protein
MHELGDKQRLLDAAQAAVADAREKEAVRARQRVSTPTSRGAMIGASLTLFVVAAYLAAVRPAWFIAPPPPPDPPALQEASVRLTLVRESQRIQAWRVANGRLPADLSEAGIPVAGLVYARLDDSTYAVALPFRTSEVTLRSTDSVAAFLGNAVGTVAARVAR